MAYTEDWEDLGRKIADMVDQAVNHQDYQKLNENIRRTVEKGTEAVRKAVDGMGKTANRPAPAPKPKDLTVYYGKTGSLTAKGLAKTIGGGLLTAVTLVGSAAALVLDAVFGFSGGAGWLALLPLAAGGGLIAGGVKNLNQVSRFKAYRKALGQKTHCALEKLARSVGKPVKFVRKEVETMISRGLFPEGHLDKEETTLIISDETYRLFESSRLQLEQRQKEARQIQEVQTKDSRVREVLDRGNAFIREIRRCNDRIPGKEISDKMDRMENIVAKIFRRAETNPEVIPDLKKMMDYYLPMTVKLLKAYADMDEQPHQGENIRNAKAEIEQSLDTLNQAFEKLLDDLFADTALDVSSDISVLQTLLAQEGLTDSGKLS